MICMSSDGLTVGEMAAPALASRFGTPLFIYDADLIRISYWRLRNAITFAPSRVHYAAVCNPNLAILRLMKEVGAGLHANTPGDVYCGLRAGFSPEEIVFSGSNLGEEDLDYLFATGVHVNVDSLDDLERTCHRGPARELGLRLHLDDILPESRIGLRESEVGEAVTRASGANCRITALHVYCGTHGHVVERYARALARLAEIAESLPDVTCLNLGGGFGYHYRDPDTAAFPFESMGRCATDLLTNLSSRTRRPISLRLEPGRALVAGAGVLLTRVRSVKWDGAVRYVGVDTTVANFTSPVVHGAHRRVVPVAPRTGHDGTAHVCGSTTYSRDFVARDIVLPEVRVGDLLAVLDAGAYGYCMASHFLNRPRAAEVMVDAGKAHLITRRESFEDLVAAQIDPWVPAHPKKLDATGGAERT